MGDTVALAPRAHGGSRAWAGSSEDRSRPPTPSLLALDEPTNDLELRTLRELEEALLEFPGVCICVTHDRFFMDRIATHILAFTGEDRALGEGVAIEGSGDATGRVFFHPGNYQSWREYYARLREKAGLPPIEAVGAHRKFSGS